MIPYDGSDGMLDTHSSIVAQDDVGTPDTLQGGVKEDTECPPLDGGGTPDKSDLLTGYVGSANGTVNDETHTFLYLGWLRSDTEGTATINFELNSGTDSCPDGSPFKQRTVGQDLLFSYNFQGGQITGIEVRTWTIGNGNKEEWSDPTTLASSEFEAQIRADMRFGELVVDMTAAGFFKADECKSFSTATMRSRASSASFENQLKDIILPFPIEVTNCGRIDIEKVDDADPPAPLKGATFTLFTDGGDEPGAEVDGKSCSTDESGKCSILDIWPATYWIVETATPANHDTAPPQEVVVAVGGNTPALLTFVNPRKPAKVNIVKTDDAGAVLKGAVFTLHEDASGSIGDSTGKSCTTGDNGTCSIENILPAGWYWLRETPPTGYEGVEDVRFELALGQTKSFAEPFVNNRKPARIDILKTDDARPAAPLAGAVFWLYTDVAGARGAQVVGKSCMTGSDGKCSITDILPPGTYWVHETVVPTGYDQAPDKKVELELNETLPLTFVNPRKPARIDIIKKDDAGDALAGATFSLYNDDNGSIGAALEDKSCTTDEDGLCSITDILPAGTYWIRETGVPDGHTAAADVSVTLGLDQTIEVKLVNNRLPATVDILKKDDTGAVLAGATFGLYNDDEGERGSKVTPGKSCTTGASGTCSITGILPPGTYWIHEDGVPDGYTPAPDQRVTLGLNQTVLLTFVDERIPATVNIVKKDDSGAALAGAGFGLYSDNDGSIGSAVVGGTCTTDASGTCSIGGILPAGTYWLHETTVPVGYEAAPDQKVTLGLAATVTLTFVDRKLVPAINVEKTGPSAVHVGDAAVYTLTVTNPGETGLSPIVVSDPRCDGAPARSTDDADGVLSPGETWVYHCAHVATDADGQSILNTVTATGTGPLGDDVSATASHTTVVLHPAVSIVKTADPESVSVSGPVTYTYVVTNTGDAVLHDVTVTDDIIGAIGSVGELAAGESVTFTKTVPVDASTPPRNIGTAVGTDILGQTVSANDDAVITVVLAAVAELPRTGSSLDARTRAAILLLQVGIFMTLAGRRRRIVRRAD
ncbi:MAG TPA: SpaA isopeptide-forming pilin-related protein [Acidimicrobiia bacterium]|nr:SpaA isopeptide-forming pilin-related protein [Acidimicrobiia bacterium]